LFRTVSKYEIVVLYLITEFTRSSFVAVTLRAPLIIEYFAKSPKVILNDTGELGVRVSISIQLKLSVSRVVSQIFSVNEWRDLETGSMARSRSLKTTMFDRSYDFLLVDHCRPKYRSMLHHFRII